MLLSQGPARNDRINLNLACSLALIAGALNSAAFYAVGFFAANMTGNVSALSDHVATAQWKPAFFFLSIVVAFIFGATVCSLIVNAGQRRRMARIYAFCILLEACLLTLLGLADIWLSTVWRPYLMTLGLAFLMGLQNATVTRISDARIRTTHVSGMATDIGIEIGVAIDILLGREVEANSMENRTRLKMHSWTIAAFFSGGVIGVLVYQLTGGYLLIACSVLLFLIAIAGLKDQRKTAAKPASHN